MKKWELYKNHWLNHGRLSSIRRNDMASLCLIIHECVDTAYKGFIQWEVKKMKAFNY